VLDERNDECACHKRKTESDEVDSCTDAKRGRHETREGEDEQDESEHDASWRLFLLLHLSATTLGQGRTRGTGLAGELGTLLRGEPTALLGRRCIGEEHL